MNTNNIKKYAPKARSAFIDAMTKQAAKYGITAKGIEPLEQKGDLALIGDRAFPASIIRPRAALVQKVAQLGFAQAMEQAAYSWFNRLCAIRFMELKDYLDHGLRVLSHPSQEGGFQIVDDCLNIELPGLDKQRIIELKLDGNQDEELYRELLLAQCHALHQAMPFLFEAIDDQTELLLPDNLTKTDSLIRELVDAIPEEDWQDVEIIGWLYQFYISEKKDQVIGKVVKSEDIPAATQLFTPNWIVKYMVQNSLGAQWLATYPDSPLKAQMEYYIEPAEQTAEVNAQLAAITPSALNPEELTLIDPACGSGHILVEGYELFKAIYLERGYRQRDLPQLILEKNLFGLDIDERAAQLTGFALMMKGRADDRRLFERGVKLNVMALQDSAGFEADTVINGVNLGQLGLQPDDLTELKRLFEHATTFGSLIQVPEGLAKKLPSLKKLSQATSQDLFVADELKRLVPQVQQAEILTAQYDAVVANPPYMGSKGMNPLVKKFSKDFYANAKSDLFSCFIERGFTLAKSAGYNSMVTMESWMFLSSYEKFRNKFLHQHTPQTLAHFPYDGKRPTVMGINFGVAVISAHNAYIKNYRASYSCSRYYELNSDGVPLKLPTPNERLKVVSVDALVKVPGVPVAYWVSDTIRTVFESSKSIKDVAAVKQGLATTEDQRFLRRWQEVDISEIGFKVSDCAESLVSGRKWFPFNKGGKFRRWYGNQEMLVNWEQDGLEIKNNIIKRYPYLNGNPDFVAKNRDFYFKSGFTWNQTGSGVPSFRYVPVGFIFAHIGSMLFPFDQDQEADILCFLNSRVSQVLIDIVSPTIGLEVGHVSKLPTRSMLNSTLKESAFVELSKRDWDSYEVSWDFLSLPLRAACLDITATLESSYTAWINQNRGTIAEMQRLEEENNRLFIEAYGLADELSADVPVEQITLTVNPAYRYGGMMSKDELWARFREDSMQELVSYAIGCMMGRYSLDEPGLIYANSGNEGFDPSRYPSFPADDDGIVPLTDKEWFADDAANRLVEFIAQAWDKTHLEANLRFLADNLSPKKGEGSRDTLRRYLCDNFFKDHLQTYKKRPIYWLFSSGKQKAFQCLVYLHRYNASTLSRMRTLHVIPLSAKLNSYANKLEQDIDASTSTAEKKVLEKQLATLHNQQAELATFDEKLRHHADLRITLDLDDGVKVNYGKFGDLLAEVKAVTGDKAE